MPIVRQFDSRSKRGTYQYCMLSETCSHLYSDDLPVVPCRYRRLDIVQCTIARRLYVYVSVLCRSAYLRRIMSALWTGPSKGWCMGVSYPGPRDVWEAPPSFRNIKYARMYHLKKNNKFFPRGAPWKCLECFPGPTVALNGPVYEYHAAAIKAA